MNTPLIFLGRVVIHIKGIYVEKIRYLDFELKVERQGDHYTARVLKSPVGEASSTFILPFSEDRLENLILKIGRLRTTTRGFSSTEMEAARELGGKLFETVFSNEVRACLRSSLNEVRNQDGIGLRLKLRLQEVAELANLPWEFLYDSSLNRFFAQSNQTPIVRYLEMTQRIAPLKVNLPLNILVMISNPANYPKLDIEQEKSQLQKELKPLTNNGLVKVDFLRQATLKTLQRRLREQAYHIFHFIGHGGFDHRTNEGVLVMEDEQGRGWFATAHQIGTILHDHRTLRLAVLNSCEGARNSLSDPFAGVATSLIRHGVPGVVAMQFEITDDAALIFSGEFYAALAAGFPVDAAVAEARKGIYTQPNDVEWGTPVLYMRTVDGVLFDLKHEPAEAIKTTDGIKTAGEIEPADRIKTADRKKQSVKSPVRKLRPEPIISSPQRHLIEIKSEGVEIIHYDGKEVSRKNSFFGATHVFQVLEQSENVEYKVEINMRGIEVTRQGEMIYTDYNPGLRTLIYKGHKIEIKADGTEIIYYDGKEVSKKDSLFGATHVFQVSENGQKVDYKVEIGARWLSSTCEVTRNGEIIYSDRTYNLRKLWV
jgi:hypothetical protein